LVSWSPLAEASDGAARVKHLQSCQRTNEYARFVGWPATPIPLFERRRCSLRVMRRGFYFPSCTAFRYPQSRTLAASPDAARYPTLPSRPATLLGSTAPFAGFLPHPGGSAFSASPGPRAVCPHPASPDRFHRAEFRDDSVLVGQRHSQPEMDSASGLRSCLWSSSTRSGASQRRSAPRVPALGFVLFQVCGRCWRIAVAVTPRRSQAPDPASRIHPLMGLRRPFAQTCRLYNRLVHLLKLLPERRRPFSVLRGSCLAESEVMSRRFGSLSEVLRRP
jgi:hypothetical protein